MLSLVNMKSNLFYKLQTILLRDKQGTDFCVACRDLSADSDKDDPGTNSQPHTLLLSLLSTSADAAYYSSQPGGGGVADIWE